MQTNLQLFELTRPQIEEAMANGYDTAVCTFGATEQHGLHLPMGTDCIWGEVLGLRIVKELGNALQLPSMRVGRSEHHMSFAGSLTVSEATFNGIVYDMCQNAAHHGFKHIVLVPTHGGNFHPLGAAKKLIQPQLPNINIIAYDDLARFMSLLTEVSVKHGFEPTYSRIGHAGLAETSMILALRPDLVHPEYAEVGFTGDPMERVEEIFKGGIRAIAENGILGDPTGATAEFGEDYLAEMTRVFVQFIREARNAATSQNE